jgi:CBS domain-containing protein
MIVDDVMTTDVITVPPSLLLKDAAQLMADRDISGLPVVEQGKVVGVISEADILEKQRGPGQGRFHRNDKFRARTVADAMTSPAITVLGRSTLPAAATLMTERGVNRLPVVDGRGLVGIVTRADLVRAFARPDDEIRADVLHELKHMWISPEKVEVEVHRGEVTLRGTVDIPKLAEKVPAAIEAVPGVVSVTSELVDPD